MLSTDRAGCRDREATGPFHCQRPLALTSTEVAFAFVLSFNALVFCEFAKLSEKFVVRSTRLGTHFEVHHADDTLC